MRERRMLQPLCSEPWKHQKKCVLPYCWKLKEKSLKKQPQAGLNFIWSQLLLEQYNTSPVSKDVCRSMCKPCQAASHWAKVHALHWAKVMESIRNSVVSCDRDCGIWIQINARFRVRQAVWNETNLRERTKMFYITSYKFKGGRKDRELLSFTDSTSVHIITSTLKSLQI